MVVVHCKWNLISHPSVGALEDNHAENYRDCEGPSPEVSEGNNVSNWVRGHCDILAKNMVAFCPCPKNLPKAKM